MARSYEWISQYIRLNDALVMLLMFAYEDASELRVKNKIQKFFFSSFFFTTQQFSSVWLLRIKPACKFSRTSQQIASVNMDHVSPGFGESMVQNVKWLRSI